MIAAVPFLVGALAARVRAQERAEGVVGYVLSVRGDWRAGSLAEPAASGRTLSISDTIRAERPPWRGHEIVIVRREGRAVRYRCADVPPAEPTPAAWDCARPIVLASTGSTLYFAASIHHRSSSSRSFSGYSPARSCDLASSA